MNGRAAVEQTEAVGSADAENMISEIEGKEKSNGNV